MADMRCPALIYGTAWKKARTAELVLQALRSGFRGIDTACQPKHYDEAGVGAGVAAFIAEGTLREQLFLQTKFTPLGGQDPQRIPYDASTTLPEQVAQSCAVSLRNLRTDYLDALLLHSPLGTPSQTATVWQAMESLVRRGAVRSLGISNCYDLETLRTLCAEAQVPPAFLQNRFYADTGYDREIRAFCRERGIVYQSFWTLTANPALLAHPLTVSLAAQYRRQPAQILYRQLTQSAIVPLIGTTSAQHMQEDLAMFGFQLTAAEQRAMDALLA